MEKTTEYDLETFLDEYQPLFGNRTAPSNKQLTRLEQFRKRYFSDSKFVNNKLSKMKKTIIFRKRNKTKEITEVEENSPGHNTDLLAAEPQSKVVNQETKDMYTREMKHEVTNIKELELDNNSDIDDENEDEDLELFAGDKYSNSKKNTTLDKATTFVRNRAKVFRKRPLLLKSRCFNGPKSDNELSPVNNENDKTVQSQSVETENTRTPKPKTSRYLWNNARKRMDYVVSFIRKKDDDETMLIAESDDDENSSVQIIRSQSCSDMLETNHKNYLLNSNTALNMKYLSPNGRKLESQASSHAHSCKSSRRNSLDLDGEPINDFLSQRYLKKSQSQHSISSMFDDKQRDFEECFFHGNDFERDGDFQCVQNNLYGSTEELGDREFEIAEHEYNDVIDEEVDSYIRDFKNKGHSLKQQKELTRYKEQAVLPNIKSTSAYSYSVNDLYDLFNKENKFKSIETSFDDLVV